MDYFCRITLPYDLIQNAFPQIKKDSQAIIVYEHPKDNFIKQTHCHFYIKGYSGSIETVKNKFRSITQCGKGNKFWSFKNENVDDTCIKYMTKGKYDPKYYEGFTQDEIDAHKANGYDKHDSKTTNIVEWVTKGQITPSANIPERNKYTTRQVVDLIADEVGTNLKIGHRDLIKVIATVLKRINVTTNPHKICELISSYRLYYDQDTWEDQIINWYEKKYM